MEWVSRLLQYFYPPRAPRPEPSAADVTRAQTTVAAASASISNAYSDRGTVFAIHTAGGDLLITSAHVTTNGSHHSRGFNIAGSQYFILVHGTHVAVARHLLVNPQGAGCEMQFQPDQPFTDISILKRLSPERSAAMLKEISWSDDGRSRLISVLNRMQGTQYPTANHAFTTEELYGLTHGFEMPPITLPDPPGKPKKIPAAGQSVAYYRNRPEIVSGTLEEIGILGSPQTVIHYHYGKNTPVVGGHSGSLLYKPEPAGLVRPLGVIAGRTIEDAVAVPFGRVREGIARLNAQNLSQDKIALCVGGNGISGWLDPTVPAGLPLASAQAQKTMRPVSVR